MIVLNSPFGTQAGQRLDNQPVRHAGIVRQPASQPDVARRDTPHPLAQQDARGNSSFNPGRIAFHT